MYKFAIFIFILYNVSAIIIYFFQYQNQFIGYYITKMKHCTANIGWYIGKFMLSISGILFIYWGFLKEKEIKCYCGAIERESRRDPNKKENYQSKSQSRCICRRRRGTTYPCGCYRDVKKNLIGKSNKLEMPQSEDITDDGKPCTCSRR